jgi:folate-binding protein YgfZ
VNYSIEKILSFNVSYSISLIHFSILGKDGADFLHRQTTQDILRLEVNDWTWAAFLDPQGKVLSYFLVARETESLSIFAPIIFSDGIKKRFEQFVIADDVELVEKNISNLEIILGGAIKKNQTGFFSEMGLVEPSVILPKENTTPNLSSEDWNLWITMQGIPSLEIQEWTPVLINNIRLFDFAVSLSKGCFPGQETVAKIHHNRGAAYYPVLIETDVPNLGSELILEGKRIGNLDQSFSVDNKFFYSARIIRDFRVQNLEFFPLHENHPVKCKVHYFPFWNPDKKLKAKEKYHEAIMKSQFHDNEAALNLLHEAQKLDPTFSDAYEVEGVIWGQMGEFEKAIHVMEKLLTVHPQSVMAHTNLSLFYMKQGKITEAEDHKTQATLATFQQLGQEAKQKEIQKKEWEAKKEKQEDRKKMFMQVLEIDPEDTLALFGMADYHFENQDWEEAFKLIQKVLILDPQYTVAYPLKAKIEIKRKELDEAKKTLQAGITIAAKRGDLMPANEMQSMLLELNP